MFNGLKRALGAAVIVVLLAAAPAVAPTGFGEAAAQTQAGAYDLAQLHPEVRRAAEQARGAYFRAQSAAARARFDQPGTIARVGNGGDRYDGDGFDDPNRGFQRNGYGVNSWNDGEHHGGAYRSGTDEIGGLRVDYGIYVYVDGRRYEGQWQNNKQGGYGVLWDPAGNVVSAGIWRDDQLVTPLAP